MSSSSHPDDLAHQVSVAGFWTLASRVALAACGLLVNMLLARLMAAEDFGIYLLAVSVVSTLILAGQLGLQVSVVRVVAQAYDANAKDDPMHAALKMALLGFLGAASCAGLFVAGGRQLAAHLLDAPALYALAPSMALWVALAAPLGILAEAFRASRQYRSAGLFSGLSSGLILLLCLLPLFFAGRGLAADVLLNLCVGASASSLLMALLHALGGRRAVKLRNSQQTTQLLRASLPLMLMSLATLVTTQADLWVAGALLPKADVAPYAMAARLLQFILMPLIVLNAVLGPTIAQLHAAGERARLARVSGVAAAVGGIPATLILILLTVLAEPLLSVFYGAHYARASSCLMLLAVGQVINTLCGPAATMLMMCGREKTVMIISLACACVTGIGGLALAPVWGMHGIALAAGLACASHGVWCLLAVRDALGIWTGFNPMRLRAAWMEFRTLQRQT